MAKLVGYGQPGSSPQVLINARTVHVGTGTDFFVYPTNQDLASQNVPSRLLTRSNFCLVPDPFGIIGFSQNRADPKSIRDAPTSISSLLS